MFAKIAIFGLSICLGFAGLADYSWAKKAVDDYVWIPNYYDNTVTRVKKLDLTKEPINVADNPCGVAVDDEYVWITHCENINLVTRISKTSLSVETTGGVSWAEGPAVDDKYVWVPNYYANTVTRINKNDLSQKDTIEVARGAFLVVVDDKYAWVGHSYENKIAKIDRDTLSKEIIDLPSYTGISSDWIAVDEEYLWIGHGNSYGYVTKMRKSDHEFIDHISYIHEPIGLQVDDTYLWVANHKSNTITRITKANLTIRDQFTVLDYPQNTCFDDNYVWVVHANSNVVYRVNKSNPYLYDPISVGTGERIYAMGDYTGSNYDRFFSN
jgi:hypothetical protein